MNDGIKIPAVQAGHVHYRVTFDRIGRNRNVAPLEVEVIHGEELAERIYKHARRHLGSRGVEVEVDMDDMRGQIFCGFRSGGTFTIEQAGGESDA